MKLSKSLALIAFGLMSSAAWAQQCPEQLKKVDDALARNPKVPAEQLADARKQRADGERAMKDGNQAACLDAANKALQILTAK